MARQRVTAAMRRRLFAAEFIANGGNGTEAAREVGYRGRNDHVLAVTASRLLTRADVRAIIDRKLDQVEDGMKVPEIMARLTELGRSDLANFVPTITPEQAALAISALPETEQGKARAEYALSVIEGRGYTIDIPAGFAAGHSQQLKSITTHHDASGLPTTKIEAHDPLKALLALAKIRGILREKEIAPAPPRNLVLIGRLNLLPSAVLEGLNQVLEAKELEAGR